MKVKNVVFCWKFFQFLILSTETFGVILHFSNRFSTEYWYKKMQLEMLQLLIELVFIVIFLNLFNDSYFLKNYINFL